MNNLKTQGFILIDVDVVTLNNAGKNMASNFDNAVGTKQILKGRNSYVYVSGQAWRYWWRDTLQKNLQWELSPVTRDSKIAFTEADPIRYADDDIFGYMRAATEEVTDEKGKKKKENITVTRVSPLKNSVLVSVAPVRTAENWSSMSRQDGDAVPYSKQEYSAVMKGMFSLDLEQAGTFSSYNKTGYKNLSDKLKKEALDSGSEELDDPFVKDAKGEPHKLVRLPKEIRQKRIIDAISALKSISGGAMQTNNMADVTPKFIILATTNTGNHPFSSIAYPVGVYNDVPTLSIEALKEVLSDYKDTFQGEIFIGRRKGFFEEIDESLQELAKKFPLVKIGSVNEAIDQYTEQLKKQL